MAQKKFNIERRKKRKKKKEEKRKDKITCSLNGKK